MSSLFGLGTNLEDARWPQVFPSRKKVVVRVARIKLGYAIFKTKVTTYIDTYMHSGAAKTVELKRIILLSNMKSYCN